MSVLKATAILKDGIRWGEDRLDDLEVVHKSYGSSLSYKIGYRQLYRLKLPFPLVLAF